MAEVQKPAVTINRRLNLVTKVESGRGTLHVFAVPVARSVFDENFMIMCRAYAEIYRNSLGVIAGPKAAARLIKQEADALNESAKGDMLLEEIRRLTNVLVPSVNGAGGYSMVDYGVAVRQGLIGEDDVDDIEAWRRFAPLASTLESSSKLVPPATMQHVEQIAGNLEKMPPKSTYFYPKLLSGLV